MRIPGRVSEIPQLTAAEEAELTAALEKIHRGQFEDGFALLREIKEAAELLEIAGIGRSGLSDLGRRHDEYLTEALER